MIVSNDILFSGVKECIKEGKDVKIVAKGNSMLPLIRTGDTVVLTKPHRIKEGMVVLVEPKPGFYLLHRVIKLSSEDMVLSGDGNVGLKEVVPYTCVVAVVKTLYRGSKTIQSNSLLWKLHHYIWPKNKFLRKYSLKVYRKTRKKA